MVRDKKAWKSRYIQNLGDNLKQYDKCFIVNVDNVRSSQMQKIRQSLRGNAEIVMGKNTMMKKVIQWNLDSKPLLEKVIPHIKENVGLVFTKGELNDIRKMILDNRFAAPAKAGTIAPVDVIVPKQTTTLGPEKTSFFQALSIQTKITKGNIEILNDVNLIHVGDKVGPSEATLLQMLNIYPFSYGLVIKQVFDEGSLYSPDVLDITQEEILSRFQSGVANLAAVSLAVDIPTAASVPHILANTFKRLLAVSLATDYTIKESESIKEYLKDPSKFASAAPAAVPAAQAKAAEKVEEKKEDSDSGSSFGGIGLFD